MGVNIGGRPLPTWCCSGRQPLVNRCRTGRPSTAITSHSAEMIKASSLSTATAPPPPTPTQPVWRKETIATSSITTFARHRAVRPARHDNRRGSRRFDHCEWLRSDCVGETVGGMDAFAIHAATRLATDMRQWSSDVRAGMALRERSSPRAGFSRQ